MLKKIKLSFTFTIFILFLCFSTNAFAASTFIDSFQSLPKFNISDNHLKMSSPNTAEFSYSLIASDGTDITSKTPASDVSVDAIVCRIGPDGRSTSGNSATASLDPLTGTGTIKYNFSDDDSYVDITLTYKDKYTNTSSSGGFALYMGNSAPEDSKVIQEINFPSDYLTKTGTNTATFQYKLSNGLEDITKDIPTSQLYAVTSIESTVALDPSTGTGTITFNSADTDKAIKLTLTDKVTGMTAILNTSGLTKDPVENAGASEISRINFVSSDLIKTGINAATFNYKILDHYYKNITKEISTDDIDATALVGSSKAQVSLDPSTGTGTVTYDFSDADNKAMISLKHKTGVEASGILNIVSSESENNKDQNSNDSEIAQIVFVPTDIMKGGSWLAWSELQYEILNKYGKDITAEIPVSQIEVSSSVNSMITLVPKERTCRLKYSFNDTDRTIIVSLSDKLTGVKAAFNIGDPPTDADTSATGTSIAIKRISGSDRYATSAAVALSGWTQSDYAILASGENFPDAISAAPLAKKYNAPILLAETNSIPEETLNAIQQLKIKNIVIIGGTVSVSTAVEQQLTSSGIVVTRIAGQDRYGTCIKVAEQLDNVNEIAIVTGESFPDALSISPIAIKRNMPIILVNHNGIPDVVKNYINSHKLTTTYVIGSGTSLNNTVLTGLPNVELITGDDKYQINLNIIDKFKSDLDLSTVYLASGENFPDALSGSILSGKSSNPLVLVGNNPSAEKEYFTNNSSAISNINVLGGTGAISDELVNELIGKSAASTPSSSTSEANGIKFISTNLTKTGTNTATFQYEVLDDGTDITKSIPISEISATASVSSSITLDPLTETGTITFNSSSDTNKTIIVKLIDNVVDKTARIDYPMINIGTTDVSERISKIAITTARVVVAKNIGYATYSVCDQYGMDITGSQLASNINFKCNVGSVVASQGLLHITPNNGIDFTKLNSVVITANDPITGVSTSATLTIKA